LRSTALSYAKGMRVFLVASIHTTIKSHFDFCIICCMPQSRRASKTLQISSTKQSAGAAPALLSQAHSLDNLAMQVVQSIPLDPAIRQHARMMQIFGQG
jgi:hypothetical protein